MDSDLDLNAVCLTCMCVSPRTLSVLSKDLKYDVTLMAMITDISSNMIVLCDGLPAKLCYSCAELLRIAYGFQQTCTSSYQTLLNYLKPNHKEIGIKSEGTKSVNDASGGTTNVQECADDNRADVLDAEVYFRKENSKDLLYGNEEYLDEALLDIDERNDDQTFGTEQLNDSSGSAVEDGANQLHEESVGENCEKPAKKHQCTVCNKVFSKYHHLKRHMLTHTQAKPFQCTVCLKSFNRSDNLLKHRLNHSSERPFLCVICKKSFKKDENLKNHLVRRHESSDQIAESHVCTICKRYFAIEANLKKHMESHSQNKEYVCEECGKQFTSDFQYRAHCRTHSEVQQKSFKCAQCAKCFKRKDYLTVHMRRHTGENPFKCKYCEKAFPRTADLKMHEKYHANIKNHHCSTCGKSFFRLSSLRIHMKIHTGEKPHKCPHCPKQFIQKYDLQTHIRRHTGERFKCELCEEMFVHVHQLKQHAKAVHDVILECRGSSLDKVVAAPNQKKQPQPKTQPDVLET